jgi:hypothetical protein
VRERSATKDTEASIRLTPCSEQAMHLAIMMIIIFVPSGKDTLHVHNGLHESTRS